MKRYIGPVVLVVMDGVGLRDSSVGNAWAQAKTEFLDAALKNYLNIPLAASGEAVGVLPGMMGNSEVGHNALGSGQIVKQGVARVEDAFRTGAVFETETWHDLVARGLSGGTLHFAGIFSDGGVHSDLKYLEQMVARAFEEGVRKIRVHAIFDGRDVAPQSEPKYIRRFEEFCRKFDGADFRIASGGGRMVVVADRYQNDWGMVEQGWKMMVRGEAARKFKSAEEGVLAARAEQADLQDQYLPAFVVVDENGEAIGKVSDGDAFCYFDFRADRAIEIAMAFTYNDFPYFDRGGRPDVYFAGMTEYNSDTHVPEHRLVEPVKIEGALNQFLGERRRTQLAISETVKFGHITYYFNGNSYEKAPGEEQICVESSTLPFNTRPWMRSAETTDELLERMVEFDFVRINYPGGDMVGHFGDLTATRLALEAIDLQLARIAKRVDELGGMMVITADHGNAEELLDENGETKTSHTTNPVPCVFYDNTEWRDRYGSAGLVDAGLSNVAATMAWLIGEEDVPAAWREKLIKQR